MAYSILLYVALFSAVAYILYLWPFYGIIGSTASLAVGTELLEGYVPQSIAVAILAFMEMLPELSVEISIVIVAVYDRNFITFISSNFTGANRILLGVGWPVIFFVLSLKRGSLLKELRFSGELSILVLFLFISNMVFLYMLIYSDVNVFISAVLLLIFGIYIYIQSKAKKNERQINSMAMTKAIKKGNKALIPYIALLLIGTGGAILYFSAVPFLFKMISIASMLSISVFYFIQWIAPVVTEFPELVTAGLWTKNSNEPFSLMALLSSQFEQWTLMIATIPLLFTLLTPAHSLSIPMDRSQNIEILLTMTESIFGCVVLFKMRILRWEFLAIFLLWIVQIADITGGKIPLLDMVNHSVLVYVYLILIILEIVLYRKELMNVWIEGKKYILTTFKINI